MGIVAISASYPRPPLGYRPSHGGALGLGGAGGHGLDPLTLLLLQKDGGLGGHGGGLGGKGKGGLGLNPLLLSLLGGCTEKYPKCTQPKIANADGRKICGLGRQPNCECVTGAAAYCLPCCTCPDTPDAPLDELV